jgi:hypothetical protein
MSTLPDHVAEELARLWSMPRNQPTVTHMMELWVPPKLGLDPAVFDEVGLVQDLNRLRTERDSLVSRLLQAEKAAARTLALEAELQRENRERGSARKAAPPRGLRRMFAKRPSLTQ